MRTYEWPIMTQFVGRVYFATEQYKCSNDNRVRGRVTGCRASLEKDGGCQVYNQWKKKNTCTYRGAENPCESADGLLKRGRTGHRCRRGTHSSRSTKKGVRSCYVIQVRVIH